MGKRTDYAMLRQGFGLARGLSDEFIQACERVSPPIEAIHRLVTPNGRVTMDEIVRRAVADWQAEQPASAKAAVSRPKPAGFSAPVVYVQPDYDDLGRRFNWVNSDYRGLKLEAIDCYKDVSRENREIAFEYVHLNRSATTEGVLAEMDRRGLRPALYEELLGFAEKYPDEQRKYPIVALGSETSVDEDRRVAFLWDDDDGRRLRLYWFDDGWDGRYRFLAVRK